MDSRVEYTELPAKPVAYIFSEDLVKISSRLPSNRNRSLLVHSLVHAYGLLATCPGQAPQRFLVVRPRPAGKKELLAYHTHDYLEYAMNESSDAQNLPEASEFGLEDVRIPNRFCHLATCQYIYAGLPHVSWNQGLYHTSCRSYFDWSSCH